MASSKKGTQDPWSMFVNDIVSEGMQGMGFEIDIIDFSKDILGVELWPTQKAILKALYNLQLSTGQWKDLFINQDQDYIERKCTEYDVKPEDWWDEREILETWVREGKSTWVEGNTYSELCLEAGMRSSKSSLTSIIVVYEFFRLFQLEDPAKHFGLMPGSLIAMLVLATTETQSKDTLFAAIRGRVENSPYFQGLISQKRLVVNALDIYSEEKHLILFAGHSNCVSGDTLIATTNGLKRIDQLVPTSAQFSLWDVDFSVQTLDGDKHVTKAVCIGKQPSLRIRTRWGYEVEGSKQHPVLVMSKDGHTTWKTLPELKVGDFVAIRRGWFGGKNLMINHDLPLEFEYHYKKGSSNINDFKPPSEMTPDLARFLGYLTGDGSVTIADRVGLKSMDPELVEDFRNLCWTLFNTRLIEGTIQENNKSRMYWAYNKKMKAYLEWLGMSSVKAPKKRIPWSILQSDEGCIKNYLRGLFDTDGYATVTNKLVGFGSTSEGLARDVQILLLKLGILSDRYRSEAQGPRPYRDQVINSQHALWQVVIRGPEVDRFTDYVGFGLKRKTDAVPKRSHKVVCDVIPYVHKICKYMRKVEIQNREPGRCSKISAKRQEAWNLIRKTIYNSHAPGRSDIGGVSALKLDRIIEYFSPVPGVVTELAYLKKLQNDELFFDPIEEITEGESFLYDIGVPDAEHFFSNGIVSHNSSGLVGRTLMIFGMDEANRFGIEGDGQSGQDLYNNVGKGTLTLNKYGSKRIVISSAWAEGDTTDKLYDKAQNGADHILAFRLPTWDVNPIFHKLKENHPDIKSAYISDEVSARRDYAGIRPGVEENFFNKVSVLKVSKYPCPVTYEPYEKVVKNDKDNTSRTYVAADIYVPTGLQTGLYGSYGHCDPGLKHDSFGFVSGHPEVREDGVVIAKIDAVVEWRPIDKGRGQLYPVSFENVDEELIRISPLLKLKRLTFDHWNCYATGSWIATPSGLRKVEDLEIGDPVSGKDTINQVVQKEIVAKQPVVNIQTKFGYSASVTPHHPLWVINKDWCGWKKAGDLKLGDRIKLDDGKNVFGDEHDPLKALVLGYLAAERDWSQRDYIHKNNGQTYQLSGVRFSNTEDEVKHDYASAFEAVFGIKPNINDVNVRSAYANIYKQVSDEISTGAHNKHVPNFVMRGTASTIGAFLSGLYEGDGNVRLNPKVLSVELNTVSPRLAEEVHLLLIRLGIKASKKYFTNKYFKGKQCPFYRITIYGENIKTFCLKVGFRSTRKKLALERAVEMVPSWRRSRSTDMYTSVVSVEHSFADIVHLEVDGDHSYVGQGLVSHNSALMIQRLYSVGVSTEEFKSSFGQVVQREIYLVLREWINNDRVQLPPPDSSPAAAKLHKELIELKIMNGRQIKHPPKGGKDLADGLAACVWKISQDERRFSYSGVGSNTVRPLGSVVGANAIKSCFEDGRAESERVNKLIDPRRNHLAKNVMSRVTRVTQDDW